MLHHIGASALKLKPFLREQAQAGIDHRHVVDRTPAAFYFL
jgi:hypothetical protein